MRVGISLVALFLGAAVVSAETFDEYISDIRVLQAKPVQKEIGLTEAQRGKMNAAAAVNRAALQKLEQKYNGQKMSPELQKKVQPEIARNFFDLKKSILSILNAGQVKRLREICLQRAGWSGLADAKVAKEVGLTDSQLSQFRTALSAGQQKVISLSRSSIGPIMAKYKGIKPKDAADQKALEATAQREVAAAQQKLAPQARKIEEDTQTKLKTIVKPAQVAKYEALKGKAFRPK